MNCPKCGRQNEDANSTACAWCGTPLELPPAPRPKAAAGKYFSRSGLVAIGLLVLGLAALAIFKWQTEKNIWRYPNRRYRNEPPRPKSELRTLAIAIEAYCIDNGSYPAWSLDPNLNAFGAASRNNPVLSHQPTLIVNRRSEMKTLTTPVAYVTALLTDPFSAVEKAVYCYWSTRRGFIVWSTGPDGDYDLTIDNVAQAYDPDTTVPSVLLIDRYTYDPSNGSNSNGDVYRYK